MRIRSYHAVSSNVCARLALALAITLIFVTSSYAQSVNPAADAVSKQETPQSASQSESASDTTGDGATMLFNHPENTRWWLSGQMNSIFQYNPPFRARYSGAQSFGPGADFASSRVFTLYGAFQVTRRLEVFADVEEFNGGGLSQGFGAASYVNMDLVRNPTLGTKPYLSRFGVHATIPLSSKLVDAERGPFNLSNRVPERRVEVRVGKFSAVDFFNANAVGGDSHKQFLNWTVDNDGTYDYPGDTREYTYGAMIEYQSPRWGARFMEGMMPLAANGIELDYNLRRSHSESYEFEFRPSLRPERQGTIRFIAFENHAHMGSYREAIANYEAGRTAVPDVAATRQFGRVKYGFGVNFDQQLTRDLTIFARAGWNEGKNESFTYTEVNQTIVAGAAVTGQSWHRRGDRIGFAAGSHAISADHRQYLAEGGLGFLIGDGKLNYGREKVVESYYTAHLWRGVYAGPDLQFIANPGYNRDRGPITVFGLRLHVDF